MIKRVLRICGIFAVAQLLGPPSSVAAVRTELRVLEQTVDRTVVQIEAGPGEDFARFAIAVPGPQTPTFRILNEDSGADTDPTGTALSTQRVYLTEPGLVRGVWSVSVYVPLRFGSGGQARRLESMTLALDHPARDRIAPGSGTDIAPSGAFLNPVVGARLASSQQLARRAPALVDDTFARSPNWLRIEVRVGGLYALDYAGLRAALGSAVDFVTPGTLRLFSAERRVQPKFPSGAGSSWDPARGLREHAIRVEASEATMVPGDRIVMFLPGVEGWSDEYDPAADWLDHEENVRADAQSFWLTWDEAGMGSGDFPAAPLRMIEVDAAPTGTPDRTLDNVRVRTHAEVNSSMFYGNTPDDWAWTTDIQSGQSRTHPFAVSGVISDSTAWFRMWPAAEIAGARGIPGNPAAWIKSFKAEFEVTGVLADSFVWTDANQTSRTNEVRFPFNGLTDGANNLRVRNRSSVGQNNLSPRMYVDFFDVHWRARLRPDAQGRRDWVVAPFEATSGQWRFTMGDPAGRLTGAVIVDVSTPFAPRWIEPGAGRLAAGAVEFDYPVVDGTPVKFQMSVNSGLRAPLRIEQHRPRLLRAEVRQPDLSAGTGYDYLILTPPAFRAAAEDLANVRRQDLLGSAGARVAVVELPDVYDQFGHGAKDPGAMRNYIKFLYEVDPRLRFVLLMGDASRDGRGLIAGSAVDWCPSLVETAWPAIPDRGDSRVDGLVPFARDDWFVSLDTPVLQAIDFELDLPDLAIGRLPVTTSAEASRLVRMIEDYALRPEPGAWKNSVLISADDEKGGFSDWEYQHVTQAEKVSEKLLPPALDIEKIYLTEYLNVGSARSKPAAQRDFIDAWSRGQLIVYYVGHGAPQQLADEVLFRIEDVTALRNGGRRPLFFGFSCDVGIFDDPSVQSMAEAMVLQPAGGAIATIAATYVTYVGVNDAITNLVIGRLYPSGPGQVVPRRTLGRSEPIGQALQEAKITGGGPLQMDPPLELRRENDAKYTILGDPAQRLQSPTENVQMTGALTQRVLTGQLEELTATAPTINQGRWELRVTESADSVRYLQQNGPGVLPYVLDGNSFFDGGGNFTGGEAKATLHTPATMRLGQNARLRILLEDQSSTSVGLVDSLPVAKGAISGNDSEGPVIAFENFSVGEALNPGQDLVAVIQDSSGVNVLGSVGANSILAEFDESGISLDFTDRFVLDESSYSRGTVVVTLPDDLEEGSHSLTLSAGDMVGNVTLEKIDFQLRAAVENGITRHAPFPNPFRDSTRFVVEVSSSLPGAVQITLDLYTVGGAHVQSLDASINGSGRVILPWEGRDRRGDELANGTYLYVVRARFGGSPPFTETATGRVVHMR